MPSTRLRIKELYQSLPRLGKADRRILLLCILVSLVFWLILNLSRTYSQNRTVRIQFLPPEDQLLVNPPRPEADLTITGQGWDLVWENWMNPELTVDVQITDDGDGRVSRGDIARLVERQLSGSELTVTELNFTAVDIRTEPKFSKRLPVRPVTDLRLATGYVAVGEITVQPDSVTVAGRRSEVDSLTYWLTDTLRLEEVEKKISREISVAAAPEGMEVSPAAVRLEQEVEVITEKAIFVPVTLLRRPSGDSFQIFPNQVRIKVGVLMRDFNTIVPDSFRLVADLRKLKANDDNVNLPLTLEKQPATARSVNLSQRSAEFRRVEK